MLSPPSASLSVMPTRTPRASVTCAVLTSISSICAAVGVPLVAACTVPNSYSCKYSPGRAGSSVCAGSLIGENWRSACANCAIQLFACCASYSCASAAPDKAVKIAAVSAANLFLALIGM